MPVAYGQPPADIANNVPPPQIVATQQSQTLIGVGQPGQSLYTIFNGSLPLSYEWEAEFREWRDYQGGSGTAALDGNSTAYTINTNVVPWAVSMPSAPYDGQNVLLIDPIGTWGTHAVTLHTVDGSVIQFPTTPNNFAGSVVLNQSGTCVWFKFDESLVTWRVAMFFSLRMSQALGPWQNCSGTSGIQIPLGGAMAVDCRTSNALLFTPVVPLADGAVFSVLDRYAASSTHPISVSDNNGYTLWNPAQPGTFNTTVTIADPSGAPVRWKFFKSDSVWLPW